MASNELSIDYDVNDTVVCIDDSQAHHSIAFMFQNWPKKDKTYTVRGFVNNDGIVTGVLLKELKNKPIFIKLLKREQEPAFATWRFKKVEKMRCETAMQMAVSENLKIKLLVENEYSEKNIK